jgi:chromosome segregation ATPase
MSDLKLSIPKNQSSSSSSSSKVMNVTTSVGSGTPTSTDKSFNKSNIKSIKQQKDNNDNNNAKVELFPKSKKSSSKTSNDEINNSLFSDIYSKLATIQPKKVENIMIDETIFIPTNWQNIELTNDDVSYNNMINNNNNDNNNIDLSNIIEIETNRSNRVKKMEKEFSSLLLEYKGIINKKVLTSTELYKLIDIVETKKKTLATLQKKCRLTVTINKEKLKEYKLSIVEEKQKTIDFAENNEKSISSISINIEDEETTIQALKNENEELSNKIIEFTNHINSRNMQFENHKRSIDLRKQLNIARKDQIEFIRNQNKTKSEIYDENISKLQYRGDQIQSKIDQYNVNIKNCSEMVTSIENYENQYNKKISELQSIQKKKEKNNSKLNNTYSDLKNELLNIDKKKLNVETMIKKNIELGITNEKKYRIVNNERKKLLQELKELGIEEDKIPFLNK